MNTPGLVDSHIHLTDFDPKTDIASVILHAVDTGVSYLVCNGTSELDWNRVVEIATKSRHVIPFLGLHPWFVGDRSAEWFAQLEELVKATQCGIGETGLDKLTKPLNRDAQEEVFRAQIRLAAKYDRPITVHCVKAWGWLVDILQSESALPERFLLHAYGGSKDMIRPLAKMGAYFSFSGKVLAVGYKHARESLIAVSADRLLIETDAPNMLPPLTPNGKEQNHPANLPLILNGIAEILGESPDALRERLWNNARRFFGPVIS